MLKAAADLCHEMGIECIGSMRPAGGRQPMTHLPQSGRSFFNDHPEYCCKTESGESVGHLSLAFPEVRMKLLEIIKDYFDGRDLDGVHFYFNRCYPFVLYEDHVVEDFTKEYGEDPKKLPFTDNRWLRHRCKYITIFMRQLREMLNKIGQKRGRYLKVCPTIVNSVENNWINGYDISTWFSEKLLDACLVHPCFSGIRTDGDFWVTPETIKPIQKMADANGIKIWADMFPRYKPAEHIRQQAVEYYDAGIYGLGFHDYYIRMPRKSEWAMTRLLGHREELKSWHNKAISMSRSYPITSLTNMSNDVRYTMLSNG